MTYLILTVLSIIVILGIIQANLDQFKKEFNRWVCGNIYCDEDEFKKELKDLSVLIFLTVITIIMLPIINILFVAFWLYRDTFVECVAKKLYSKSSNTEEKEK